MTVSSSGWSNYSTPGHLPLVWLDAPGILSATHLEGVQIVAKELVAQRRHVVRNITIPHFGRNVLGPASRISLDSRDYETVLYTGFSVRNQSLSFSMRLTWYILLSLLWRTAKRPSPAAFF